MDPQVATKLPSRRRVRVRPAAGRHVRVRPAAVARLVASGALFAIGIVHIQQYIGADYRVIPTIGQLFLLNFIGGTAFGIYFLIPVGPNPSRIRSMIDAMVAVAAWGLAAGAFVGLIISEHTPLFGFMEHGYRFAIVFALASEAVAMVALMIQLARTTSALRTQKEPQHRRPLAA